MPTQPNPPIVLVVWKDACSQEAAGPHTEVEPGLVVLREVGFLLGESDEAITIGMEVSDDATAGRWRLHIPRVNIISRTLLAPKARGKK